MTTTARKTRTSLVPVIGLLTLAAMLYGAAPASAQLDCELPGGITPTSNLRVTAAQVEEGSASLMDFALAAKDQMTIERTTAESIYLRCLVRQEGSPWRSGSTYTLQLGPTGRVRIHAKDMSLSGRKLRPVIYDAVLESLGISPTVLTDPATAGTAFAEVVAGDGGLFDVPGIPGASGYATAFRQPELQRPMVQITGFDLDKSHLISIEDEMLDYGDPPLAAEVVVDRATLKAFVNAAVEYITSLLESADLSDFSKARIAMRDPDGPWRHDPVYLGITEYSSKLIVFHGAFPDRFEFRRAGISRDIATGELVFDQLVAAAESGPEGGYWLYHFDSPVDDTDSEDIPKLGYARVFTTNIMLPDGNTLPTDFIINSGFYLTPDSVFVQRLLGALDDGQVSIMFGITAPEDGDAVAGDAVTITVEGAPTDTVHFAYRLAGLAEEPFTYLGAATNREAMASFAWDTLDLPDDDYEVAALYTEDDGHTVTYDVIEVNVDNVSDGGGGCVAVPVLPGGGGPMDPTLPALVGLIMAWIVLGRRHQTC